MKTLIAHRGMSTLAPENTLSSFALCKEHGVKWFECDVDILQDGTVIISHDDTLDRCTNYKGSVCNINREDLKKIDAGSWFADQYIGERIPTFAELVDLSNRLELNLNIEIKSCTASAKMSRKLIEQLTIGLKSLDSNRELIVSSFNHLALHHFKQSNPTVKVACLYEHHTLYDDWKSVIEWCGAEYIHPEDKGLTKALIDEFKSAGLKVNVWTVNDLARANQLFNWGVDGIFTDIAHNFPSMYKDLI